MCSTRMYLGEIGDEGSTKGEAGSKTGNEGEAGSKTGNDVPDSILCTSVCGCVDGCRDWCVRVCGFSWLKCCRGYVCLWMVCVLLVVPVCVYRYKDVYVCVAVLVYSDISWG
eukprot:GHVQ01004019.1.p2 GENE.GHVQ01004019.1~~GHVQ01004019.1.p2  ORF type:complete len:112 (+),score=17.58 GHVQ01004019.1:228-563(+)